MEREGADRWGRAHRWSLMSFSSSSFFSLDLRVSPMRRGSLGHEMGLVQVEILMPPSWPND